MSEVEGIIFDLDVRVSEMTLSELRKLELIAYRAIGLLRRMGLPENIDEGIAKLQRLVMTIRLAHTTLVAFATATGPFGTTMALLSLGATAFTASDFMTSLGE